MSKPLHILPFVEADINIKLKNLSKKILEEGQNNTSNNGEKAVKDSMINVSVDGTNIHVKMLTLVLADTSDDHLVPGIKEHASWYCKAVDNTKQAKSKSR